MKIALLISGLGPGGAERVMSVLANGLVARGHTVCLITLAGTGRDFHALDERIERRGLELTGDSRGYLGAVLANLRRLVELRRTIRAAAPRGVVSFVTRMNILTLIACAGLRTRVVVSERVDPASHSEGIVWDALRRWTYPLADSVVVQTESIARWFRSNSRHPDRVTVIPNPAPQAKLGKTHGTELPVAQPYVLGAGRLVRQKGFDLLLRGFSLVAPSRPDLKLAIAGEGRDLPSLRQLAASLGIERSVFFLGTVDNLLELMRSAMAFVLSSRYEGFPNVLLEALFCGVPTIASDCPAGPREILADGKYGLLVPCEDPQALGQAIAKVVGDADLRRKLAALGPLALLPFEHARVLDAWEAVLRTH